MKIKGFDDTINWYDQNAKVYADKTYAVPPHDLLEQFIKLLPINPRTLDAGCGPGRDTKLLTNLGANVTGLDISTGLLEEARKRNPEIQFVKGNFLDIPFPGKTFDGIWAHAALVHLEEKTDAKKAITEFFRVLKKGGILHLYVKKQIGDNETEIVEDKLSHHERFFRYYREDELRRTPAELQFTIKEFEIREDPHGRKEVQWLSLFAEK